MTSYDCAELWNEYARSGSIPEFLVYQEFTLSFYSFRGGRLNEIVKAVGGNARLDGGILHRSYNSEWVEYKGG